MLLLPSWQATEEYPFAHDIPEEVSAVGLRLTPCGLSLSFKVIQGFTPPLNPNTKHPRELELTGEMRRTYSPP